MTHQAANDLPLGTASAPRARGRDIRPGIGIWQRGLDDLGEALSRWNLIVLIGASDVASRYRRSALGQFWLTLSNALLIVAIGFVWANIWKQPLAEFLPYLAAGHVFWLLMTGTLMDASTTFANSASYMKELNLPRSTYLFANMIKHLVILAHNIVIIPAVFLFFGIWPSIDILMFLPALALTVLTLLAASFWLGVVGLRFRDVAGIVSSLVMVLFFLTPVIWREQLIEPHLRDLLVFNPFHVFLELLRAPILGHEPKPHYWLIGLGILAFNVGLGFIVFAKWRRSITFWL
jgi:ABC-2 type transport system permease protein/lipopolysaccharide transport system permease protein